jgi:hypothetical protein
MNEYEIDPAAWFGERELKFTPPHFIATKTPLTPESKQWILTYLKGRFSLVYQDEGIDDINLFSLVNLAGSPAFEIPQEAIIYELKWA